MKSRKQAKKKKKQYSKEEITTSSTTINATTDLSETKDESTEKQVSPYTVNVLVTKAKKILNRNTIKKEIDDKVTLPNMTPENAVFFLEKEFQIHRSKISEKQVNYSSLHGAIGLVAVFIFYYVVYKCITLYMIDDEEALNQYNHSSVYFVSSRGPNNKNGYSDDTIPIGRKIELKDDLEFQELVRKEHLFTSDRTREYQGYYDHYYKRECNSFFPLTSICNLPRYTDCFQDQYFAERIDCMKMVEKCAEFAIEECSKLLGNSDPLLKLIAGFLAFIVVIYNVSNYSKALSKNNIKLKDCIRRISSRLDSGELNADDSLSLSGKKGHFSTILKLLTQVCGTQLPDELSFNDAIDELKTPNLRRMFAFFQGLRDPKASNHKFLSHDTNGDMTAEIFTYVFHK